MSASILGANNSNLHKYFSALPLELGFAKIEHVSLKDSSKYQLKEDQMEKAVQKFCQNLASYYKKYNWHDNPCGSVKWLAHSTSHDGYPLLYTAFGDGSDKTLFLGGVHPDELTPVHLAFRFARYLNENPQLYKNKGITVVIAPLVNPDGFLIKNPTRTNGRVDVNRNFFTLDWFDKATQIWGSKAKYSDRYFPGYFPNTEIETIFQVELIDKFKPNKLLSVHAPLGFLDYDGPGDQKPKLFTHVEKKAKELVYEISKKTNKYRVVDYSFFPGSLGNFAGNERSTPTVTVELETSKPSLVNAYWDKFLPGFIQSIYYTYRI